MTAATYAIVIVAAVAVCTFITRLLPFAVFGTRKEPPGAVKYIGEVLPAAVIAILIVYCFRSTDFSSPGTLEGASGFAPAFISVALVILLHLWKRNNLLSIGTGTVCYMIMIQYVFV